MVVVFGSKDTPDTQKLLNNPLSRARGNKANDAIYLYIDTDKVKDCCPNPEVAKYVDKHVRGQNRAYTMTFSMKPDENGHAIPEVPRMATRGGGDHIEKQITDTLPYCQQLMAQRKSQFRIPQKYQTDGDAQTDQAARPKEMKKERTQAEKMRENEALSKSVMEGLKKGTEAKHWSEGQNHYHDAIRAADKIDAQSVQQERDKLAQELKKEEAAGNKQRVEELKAKDKQLKFMQDARWISRASLGMACIGWGYKDTGEQWLMAAADINPGMLQEKELFLDRMQRLGYSAEDMNAFSKRVADRFLNQTGPHTPEGFLSKDIRKPAEQPDKSIRDPQVRPASYTETETDQRKGVGAQPVKEKPKDAPKDPAKEAPKDPPKEAPKDPAKDAAKDAPEDAPKDAAKDAPKEAPKEGQKEKHVFTEQEYAEALREAAKTGKPLVIKFGATWCGPCRQLKDHVMGGIEEKFKDKAIFLNVDIDKRPDIAQAFGVESVPTIITASLEHAEGNQIRPKAVQQPWQSDMRVEAKTAAAVASKLEKYLNSSLADAGLAMERAGFRKPKPPLRKAS